MTNLALVKKDTVDVVAQKVREFQERGEINFPANYSPENAMKAAWLTIQEVEDKDHRPALDVCDRNSIANALLNMVVQGLNPVKKQCYFVVYGKKLVLQRSYFGSVHVAKTVEPSIIDVVGDVVYEGDELKYIKKSGKTIITEHSQQLANIDKGKIVAAYATVLYKDGSECSTIMTLDEIKQAWRQSKTNPVNDKGDIRPDSVHGKFMAEMCKKTAISKACKYIINSSDDSSLIIKLYKATDDELHEAEVEEEISENANKTVIDAEIIPDSAPAAAPVEDDLP